MVVIKNQNCKPVQENDAYPAVIKDTPQCESEGSNTETKTEFCLCPVREPCKCPPVPDYGEVPVHSASGLSSRVQAFAWSGLSEGDGLVEGDGDASEGSGETEGAGEGNDAGGAYDHDVSISGSAEAVGGPSTSDPSAGGCGGPPDSVTGHLGTDGAWVEATWDTSDKGDNDSSSDAGGAGW